MGSLGSSRRAQHAARRGRTSAAAPPIAPPSIRRRAIIKRRRDAVRPRRAASHGRHRAAIQRRYAMHRCRRAAHPLPPRRHCPSATAESSFPLYRRTRLEIDDPIIAICPYGATRRQPCTRRIARQAPFPGQPASSVGRRSTDALGSVGSRQHSPTGSTTSRFRPSV